MSIREVTEIPSALKKALKETDRDKVRKDFYEALEKRIEVFEFEGDYNFKTLGQKAKEVAQRQVFYSIYAEQAKKVERVLQKEFPDVHYLCAYEYYHYRDNFFKVKNIKKEDRIHVYASIDYRFIDSLYEQLLEDTRADYQRRARKEREEE